MKNVVCKVKKPTKRLEGIAKTIFPEQETICIIDGNQLNQLIYKFAIKKIKNYNITKKSIDARKKPNLFYIYELDVVIINERRNKHELRWTRITKGCYNNDV